MITNFFKDFGKENGIKALREWYKELYYIKSDSGQYVLKQDEYGDTYYIILEGKVAVILNLSMTKLFSLQTLFTFIVDKYNLLIDNDQKQTILRELK